VKGVFMTISLVSVLLALVVIGLILYLIRMLPIEGWVKNVAYVVVIIFVIVWLIQMLGGGPVIKFG